MYTVTPINVIYARCYICRCAKCLSCAFDCRWQYDTAHTQSSGGLFDGLFGGLSGLLGTAPSLYIWHTLLKSTTSPGLLGGLLPSAVTTLVNACPHTITQKYLGRPIRCRRQCHRQYRNQALSNALGNIVGGLLGRSPEYMAQSYL